MYSKVIPFIIAFVLLSPQSAKAHDWYSSACCSSKDCHPVDSCSEITESADGGADWNGYHFAKTQIKPSEDNKCHVCIHDYGPAWGSNGGKMPMCVYIQQGS